MTDTINDELLLIFDEMYSTFERSGRGTFDDATAMGAILALFAKTLEQRVERIAKEYDLPSITTWKQGHFIDQPQYSRNSQEWKAQQEERERTLIRPGGGTNNALFQVSGAYDNHAITKYLEALGDALSSGFVEGGEK